MSDRVRVLVADDQPLLRAALRALIETEGDLELVGEAADGAEAIRLAARTRPDVVLMDVRMPGVDGVAATAAITGDAGLSATRVLVLTTFEDDETVVAALRAGASGFVGKGTEPDALMGAIRVVAAGEALLSPGALRSIVSRSVNVASSARPAALAELTERELEVLRLVARGRTNDEIADRLTIAVTTAKTHVNRVMTKLAAHDRAQLVVLAYETGLVTA